MNAPCRILSVYKDKGQEARRRTAMAGIDLDINTLKNGMILLGNEYIVQVGNIAFKIEGNLNTASVSSVTYQDDVRLVGYTFDSTGAVLRCFISLKKGGNMMYSYDPLTMGIFEEKGSAKEKAYEKQFGEKLQQYITAYLMDLRETCPVKKITAIPADNKMKQSLDSLFQVIVQNGITERGKPLKDLFSNDTTIIDVTYYMYLQRFNTEIRGQSGNGKTFISPKLAGLIEKVLRKQVSFTFPRLCCVELGGYTSVRLITKNGRVLRIEYRE